MERKNESKKQESGLNYAEEKRELINRALELNEDVLRWIHGGATCAGCCAWNKDC